jgi:hypothetical protein
MEAMREVWTDERLDDLNHRVDTGFGEVNNEFRALRLELRAEFTAVRTEMSTQFAAQQRMMTQRFGGMFATMVVGFLAAVPTIITQT